jgi:phosphatidylinositol 4-kinase
LYDVYLKDLLLAIVAKGDVQELEHHRPHTEISATAEEIARLIPPLAELLPKAPAKPYETKDMSIISLFRNAWFNMVVHGFAKNSSLTVALQYHLEIIARSTPPLVSEVSSNKTESELELNTVLRRGSSNHNVSNQKAIMGNIFSLHNFEFRTVPYPKLMFLSAAVLLESLRANTGNCSKVLLYFGDPGFKSGDTSRYMANIATDSTKAYIKNVIRGGQEEFTVDRVAEQLKGILILCCHRVSAIQNIAFTCAELLIKSIPGALCRRTSLFALLDLLTLIWTSCLDAETDEYEPRTSFTSPPETNITLELSDSYEHRRDTMRRLMERSRAWAEFVLSVMSNDLKSLLTAYLASKGEYRPISHVALGCTFAMEIGSLITKGDGSLATIAQSDSLTTDTTSGFLSQYIWRTEFKGDRHLQNPDVSQNERATIKKELEMMISDHSLGRRKASFDEVRNLLFKATVLLSDETERRGVARMVVQIPFKLFTEKSIQLGISLWLWAINELPQLKPAILSQIGYEWECTVKERKGLFSQEHDLPGPEYTRMEYAPSNKAEIDQHMNTCIKAFSVHLSLIRFLSSVFQASTYESKHFLRIFTRLLTVSLDNLRFASRSALARSVRFELIKFAIDVYQVHARFSAKVCDSLKDKIITAALTWFEIPPHWPFGGNRLKLRSDVALLKEVAQLVTGLEVVSNKYNDSHKVNVKKDILLLFLNDELKKMVAWLDPLQTGPAYRDSFGKKVLATYGSASAHHIKSAWSISPVLSTYLAERYSSNENITTIRELISREPIKVIHVPVALRHFLGGNMSSTARRNLLYWTPVCPAESINLFLPDKGGDALLLQYAMRSLESHDVNTTFFYVPQIVQTLRYDRAGYVARYILETAKLSQLFSHQIIWNMLANSYMDEDSEIPDPLKPTLDDITEKMLASFNDDERSFYEREFSFFNEVTSISGKLKPYIKKSKAEKKTKIDEEIDKIKVDVGVYLPSNPDGTVVDIDRKSGKPLQSHAKAPFMATFKIHREVPVIKSVDEDDSESSSSQEAVQTIDAWQSAIFKVGDDCRQDVLALQIIAVFRSIFKHSGLDLYVYPYRVTATAPGCGVIDVLPNSISRDMLGREAVNGLYEYFTTKHGGEDSIAFQRARNNFVKSLAAYSVISYLIQFKDRHNGNIMYDSQGHILHIDFGFCFDIVPGGVKFEAAPFKLTHEMVMVMGGSTETQAYKWFEELCVKAFLSCRPYCDTIIEVVRPMLDSGLPCFKGELTIKKLRNRFALDKTEREAALHFRSLIRRSYESNFTKGYDEFQRITNGIPY